MNPNLSADDLRMILFVAVILAPCLWITGLDILRGVK